MKIPERNNSISSSLIKLKDEDWLSKQRIAGKTVAQALQLLSSLVKEKSPLSLLEMNGLAEQFIISQGCTPTFKYYKDFPAGVCISVNRQLVHGIPTNNSLKEGDVVSFDLGATYEGAISDAAITCIYGEPKQDNHVQLIQSTKTALELAIREVQVGKRLGSIGNTIFKCGREDGFSVITEYGGHGLDWNRPHSLPFVSNRSEINDGIRAQKGLTIAIEPLFAIGSNRTRVASDNWTVYTEDVSAHFEHTIYVHQDHVEVLTRPDATLIPIRSNI